VHFGREALNLRVHPSLAQLMPTALFLPSSRLNLSLISLSLLSSEFVSRCQGSLNLNQTAFRHRATGLARFASGDLFLPNAPNEPLTEFYFYPVFQYHQSA